MDKKRVLHIVETLETGVRSFLIDITKRQVEEYEVFILFGLRGFDVENAKKGFDPKVKFVYLSTFKGAMRSIFNFGSYYSVRKVFFFLRPDIVHLHSSAAGFIGRLALPCRKANVVYTPHCIAFLRKDISKFKKAFFYVGEKVASKFRSTIVACGKGEFEHVKKLTKKCVLINNGIDMTNLVTIKEDNGGTLEPVVATTARISYQKNPFLFNEIAKALPDISFVWIGDGELREVLTSPNIEVTGWIPREKIYDKMKNVSIFILPSLWEGLSISLLEAMYYKKVCIVSNCIGNTDAIVNGVNGFVCNTVEDYKNCISEVLSDSDRMQVIRNNAKETVEKVYNIDNMYKEYKSLYTKILLEKE